MRVTAKAFFRKPVFVWMYSIYRTGASVPHLVIVIFLFFLFFFFSTSLALSPLHVASSHLFLLCFLPSPSHFLSVPSLNLWLLLTLTDAASSQNHRSGLIFVTQLLISSCECILQMKRNHPISAFWPCCLAPITSHNSPNYIKRGTGATVVLWINDCFGK